jgi:hypothetical protein
MLCIYQMIYISTSRTSGLPSERHAVFAIIGRTGSQSHWRRFRLLRAGLT